MAEENQPGGRHVALISSRLWQNRFGGDPNILGKPIQLNSEAYMIIGILPPATQILFDQVDIWVSDIKDFEFFTTQQMEAGAGYLTGIARMKSGATQKQAQAELDTLNLQYQASFPQALDAGTGTSIRITPLHERIVRNVRPTLLLLWSAIILVLFVASANVANLFAALATTRRRQIAIRSALGASSWRIIRQLLIEGNLLALSAALMGSIAAPYAARFLLNNTWDSFAPFRDIRPDWRVWVLTCVVCGGTGIAIAMLPGFHLLRINPNEALRDGGPGFSATRGAGMRIRDGLVTSQIALSIVLLIGAGLMVKSIIKLNASDPGFDAHNVLTMHLTLPESKYPTPEQKRIFFKRAVAAVSSIPGVRSSAVALTLPLSAAKPRAAVLTDGSPVVPLAQRPFVYWQAITPEYFHVMGIRLLRGREFDEHDDENGATVAIINEAMAKRFWSDRDPIGKQIMIATQLHPKIVGIIKDVDTGELGGSTGPEVYTPYSQWPIGSGTLVVRTVPEPRSMLSSVISRIATIDKDEPVSQVETMEEIVAGSLGNRRLMSFVLLAFALVCLVLGIIGVYGATTYWIRTRMHELAIRTILGACPRDITRLVLQKGLRLVCGGVIIGLAAALAFTQLMRSLLFGVSTHDPTIFCLAAITFTLIAVTTIYIPTRKVANADPLLFLRKSL